MLVAKVNGEFEVEPVDAAFAAGAEGRAVEVVAVVFQVFEAEEFDVGFAQGFGGVEQPVVFDEFGGGELVGRARGEGGVQAAQGGEEVVFECLVARVLQVVAGGGGL